MVPGGHKDLASARQRLAELKGGVAAFTEHEGLPAMHHTIRSIAVLAVICESSILGAQAPKAGSKPTQPVQAAQPLPEQSARAGLGRSAHDPVDRVRRRLPEERLADPRRRGILIRGPVSQITRSRRRDREDESTGAPRAQRNQRSDRHSRDRRLAAAPAARDGVFTSVRGFPAPDPSSSISPNRAPRAPSTCGSTRCPAAPIGYWVICTTTQPRSTNTKRLFNASRSA